MTRARRLIAAVAGGLGLTAALTANVIAVDSPIRGFSPGTLGDERKAEAIVLSAPSENAARRHEYALASYVHRMGTPGDRRTAVYVRDALAKAGWNARLVTYVVPIAWPTEQRLELLTPRRETIDLYEAAIPGDPWSREHADIGIPYSGYSVDGDVRGPVVYANYALPSDFATLAKAGVNVHGAVVVARVGKGALTAKAFASAARGALATLVFPDPMDGGYFKGDPYPRGPWRPTSAAMRNTMTFTNAPGDPTAIGIPVPGAPHKAFSAIRLPSIPEMPITADVARRLIASMGGPLAPAAWHGGFALPLHLGGRVRAHVVLRSHRFFGPIWDVIATLKGRDPQQLVVAGGHRDAWTYGAVDPISGTVDLIQLGEAFGRAYRGGWRPQRTIVIGSWDGEELNLFGSQTWVAQNEALLRAGCVAYVNTDEVAYGPVFEAYATPDLAGLMRKAARDVRAPDGKTIDAEWPQAGLDGVDPIGGGSDHEPFVYHENLPAAGAGFGGPFGTYHSAYDDIASLRILDPGMRRAAAIARYTSLVTMRLADANVPDVRLSDLAAQLVKRFNAFRAGQERQTSSAPDKAARLRVVVDDLNPALEGLSAAATRLDARIAESVASGDVAGAQRDYRHLRAAEAAFYDPAGVDAHRWSRSLLYGVARYDGQLLPSLDQTLASAPAGDAALARLENAIRAATAATGTAST